MVKTTRTTFVLMGHSKNWIHLCSRPGAEGDQRERGLGGLVEGTEVVLVWMKKAQKGL